MSDGVPACWVVTGLAVVAVVSASGCRVVLGIDDGHAVAGEDAFPTDGLLADAMDVDAARADGDVLVDSHVPCWRTVGPLHQGRCSHRAARLASGDVIVTGGVDAVGAVLGTAEVYSLKSETWTATGLMSTPRAIHGSALLLTGRILTFGGYEPPFAPLKSSEVFDPADGGWTSGPPMNENRISFAIATLPDGRVFVAGGINGGYAGTEVYNGSTWASLPRPLNPSAAATLTSRTKAGDLVYVGGGVDDGKTSLATVASFAITSATWSPLPSLKVARQGHAAAVLPSGGLLVAGGTTAGAPSPPTLTERLDGGVWSDAGSLAGDFSQPTATELLDGRVLLVGGASAAVFDEATGAWTTIPRPNAVHAGEHTATRLDDGRILIVGGQDSSVAIPVSELFDPACL